MSGFPKDGHKETAGNRPGIAAMAKRPGDAGTANQKVRFCVLRERSSDRIRGETADDMSAEMK